MNLTTEPSISLTVKKQNGLFTLYEKHEGEPMVVINSFNAQLIIDHLDAHYPKGTIARWFIIPTPRPLETARPRAVCDASPVSFLPQLTAGVPAL